MPLEEGEKINAVLPIKQFDDERFVFMATSHGTVKKTPLSAYSRPRPSGIIAVDLRDGDRLVGVGVTDGKRDIILCSSGLLSTSDAADEYEGLTSRVALCH